MNPPNHPLKMIFDASQLQIGEIRIISEVVCIVRTEEGVFALGRRCPHAGADLAAGYVEGGLLFCAWHNLYFNVRTGDHPCARISPAKAFPLKRLDGEIYEISLI